MVGDVGRSPPIAFQSNAFCRILVICGILQCRVGFITDLVKISIPTWQYNGKEVSCKNKTSTSLLFVDLLFVDCI
jgi:hypothetical protein